MKKIVVVTALPVALLVAGAGPALADASGYGSQPGFDVATSHTDCAGHGAFGAFGTYGDVGHDFRGGADGEQTGANNSGLCGNPQR